MRPLAFVHFVLLLVSVVAQSSTTQPPSSSPSVSLSVFTSTRVSTIITTTHRDGDEDQVSTRTLVSSIPVNVTSTIPFPASTTSATPSETPEPIVLDTKIDPAFGVLGAILILTGLPNAFWGHKNRWTSFFIMGFYTLSLVCFVLITKFGILAAVNPPSQTIRGMFVLASGVAGIAGGAIAIFFWKGARYFIGGWGGFALALWIQCFRNGGVIREVGYRWIFFIGCAVLGFALCTIPKIHYHLLLLSTAIVGASATILGADCYTTAGLKEFYMWNLGFHALFPKFTENGIQYPVSQTMQIELGMMAAIAVMGTAVQLRILGVLQRKLKEINEDQKKRDEEAECSAAEHLAHLDQEREAWEKEHPTLHGRNESSLSSMPLKDPDGGKTSHESRASPLTLVDGGRQRTQSGISEFMTAPATEDDIRQASRKSQPRGLLPTLDVGFDLENQVPDAFISSNVKDRTPSPPQEKDELFNDIRRSIDFLRSDTGSAGSHSRRVSLSSRHTLSLDAATSLGATSHVRPQPGQTSRSRVQSMELSTLGQSSVGASAGASIARPASAPLRDEEWDAYVKERKLFQPPSGVTPPISTSQTPHAPRSHLPAAVAEAMDQRRGRESEYLLSEAEDSEDTPLSRIRAPRSPSPGGVPITVLPPKKYSAPPVTPSPRRPDSKVKTFEELEQRHRDKLKELQAPLTEAENEHAAVTEARARWERVKEAEKRDVARRQAAEQAVLRDKRKKADGSHQRPERHSGQRHEGHTRSLSADKLAALGGTGSSSKRVSTMKVQDWQRYQEADFARKEGQGSSRRRPTSEVPFPAERRSGLQKQ